MEKAGDYGKSPAFFYIVTAGIILENISGKIENLCLSRYNRNKS